MFTSELRDLVSDNWNEQFNHPFVQGIGDGSLDVDRFRNWIRQDYLYLKDFARVFAWATARAPTLDRMSWYTSMQDLTLNTEMDLHREYARQFGVFEEDLESAEKWPTTQAYTNFLIRNAADGDLVELVAVLLPCSWGYAWIGKKMEKQGVPDDERYAEWIRTYSSEDFQQSAEWLKDEMNRLSEGCTKDERTRLRDLFLRSSEYELRFWDMCYYGEDPFLERDHRP